MVQTTFFLHFGPKIRSFYHLENTFSKKPSKHFSVGDVLLREWGGGGVALNKELFF